jgi:outer membrane protein assembly factor BamB
MVMTEVGDIEVPRVRLLAGERVVAVGHAGHVHLLDLQTGETLWTRSLAAQNRACEGQPVTVSVTDEIVLAGSMGHIFAIRRDDGTVLWHREQRSRGDGETSLAVGASGTDYVARLES